MPASPSPPVRSGALEHRSALRALRAVDPDPRGGSGAGIASLPGLSIEADPLSDRERSVLRLAGEGRSASEIAEQLGLSHGTVRNYLSECIGKLGVANRIEAHRLARQKGWL